MKGTQTRTQRCSAHMSRPCGTIYRFAWRQRLCATSPEKHSQWLHSFMVFLLFTLEKKRKATRVLLSNVGNYSSDPSRGTEAGAFYINVQKQIQPKFWKISDSISHTRKQTELGKDLRLAERQGNKFPSMLHVQTGKTISFLIIFFDISIKNGRWRVGSCSTVLRTQEQGELKL